MIYKISQSKDLESITELVYKKNNTEAHHILYACKTRESIYKDYENMLNGERNLVVTAWDDHQLCGVLGIYCIEEINRVDCVGPFVDCTKVNSQENEKLIFMNVSKKMLDFARNEYPEYHFSFNINSKNVDCIELMKVLGSEAEELELKLGLKRGNFINESEKSLAIPFSLEYEEQLRNLHDQTAPGIYLTSNQLIKTIGASRKVYLLIEENQLIAYGVLHSMNTDKEVSIEIIGVDKNYKGKGYGRMILNHLLTKAFERESIEEVKLIVDDTNTIAKNLYESVGFECILKSCSFSLTTSSTMVT